MAACRRDTAKQLALRSSPSVEPPRARKGRPEFYLPLAATSARLSPHCHSVDLGNTASSRRNHPNPTQAEAMKKDAAYYEAAYNPRVGVPDFSIHFERWKKRAQED